MLAKSLERLEEVLDLETSALMAHDLSGLEELNRRKSQSLLEISRLVRTMADDALDPRLTARLARLRTKLDENQEILQRHMRAVQEVADIVANAIQSAESDGTYSVGVQRVAPGL